MLMTWPSAEAVFAVASPAAWLLPLPPHPASSAAMEATAIAPASKVSSRFFLLVWGRGRRGQTAAAVPCDLAGTGLMFSLSDCDFIIGANPAANILAIQKNIKFLTEFWSFCETMVMILPFLHNVLIFACLLDRYNGKNK